MRRNTSIDMDRRSINMHKHDTKALKLVGLGIKADKKLQAAEEILSKVEQVRRREVESASVIVLAHSTQV